MSTNSTIPAFDISQIAGNAPDSIKLQLGNIPGFLNNPKRKFKDSFGRAIEFRMKLTELSIISKAEEPNKLEGRAVLEVDVAEGILFLPYL
jgi:acyl-coenzyme A thioesterase 13